MMSSDFQDVKRKLIKMKIEFKPSDVEPRFEIYGKHFTVAELMKLNQKNGLTTLDLSEIARLK